MTKKANKKAPATPTKAIILGSSNNKYTHLRAEFCLPTTNLSKPGAHCKIGYQKNYANYCLPIQKNSVYLLNLSFNFVLRYPSQISTLHLTFVKNVLELIKVLSGNGLNVRKNLIVVLPLVRHTSATFPTQLTEIQKLESKLFNKNIFFVNAYNEIPEHIKQNDYFDQERNDNVHYSFTVQKIISKINANALDEFLKSRW